MKILVYFVILFTARIVPVELQRYDIIIIPVHMVDRSQSKHYETIQRPKYRERKRSQYDRLDVENYEEPAVTPDLDNFEYKDREDSDQWTQDFGDDKIVGGVEVPINLYPYHVLYGSNCGGAIIDSKWILTAGHCGKKAFVRVGSKYLNEGTKYMIRNNYIHPGWSAANKEHPFDFDFQLLELSERLPLSDSVQPIKVGHLEDMMIGKVITVTGWGNTEENGPYSKVLRAVRVPIISKENCQGVPFPYFRGSLTTRMFCAGFAEGKKDACQGDSGGPAVSNGRLLGMVSFGYGCATPGSYGVYSKVAKVRGWIEEVTGLNLDRL